MSRICYSCEICKYRTWLNNDAVQVKYKIIARVVTFKRCLYVKWLVVMCHSIMLDEVSVFYENEILPKMSVCV